MEKRLALTLEAKGPVSDSNECEILLQIVFFFQVTCCQTDNCNNASFTSTSDGTTVKITGFLLTLILLISGCKLTDYLY